MILTESKYQNLKNVLKFWYFKACFLPIIEFNKKKREKIKQVFMAVEIDYLNEYFHTFPFTGQRDKWCVLFFIEMVNEFWICALHRYWNRKSPCSFIDNLSLFSVMLLSEINSIEKINKMRRVSACLKLYALIVPVKCFDPLFKYLIHFSKLFFINTCRFVALRQNEGWHVVELTCSHFYHPLPPSEKGMEYHEPI